MSKGSNSKANKENKKAKKSNKKNKSASVAVVATEASVDEIANHKLSKTATSASLNITNRTSVATTPSDSIQNERAMVDVLSTTTTGVEFMSYANDNQTLDSNISSNKSELNDSNILANNKNEALKTNTSSTSSLCNATTSGANSVTKNLNNGSQVIKNKANSKSNDRFHQLFPSVSIEESVIDTYSCAFVKSLNLFQGVMFLTQNYICFYSKIITHETILIIKLADIKDIVKTMHAVIFPTAIRINTQNSSYSFTSFISRSHTLEHLNFLLLKARERQIEHKDTRSKANHLSRSETCNNYTTNHNHEQMLKLNQSLPECHRLAKLSQQLKQKQPNFYLNNNDDTHNSTNSIMHDHNNNKLDTLSIETAIINDLNNVNEEFEEFEVDNKLEENGGNNNSDDVKMIMLAKSSNKANKEVNQGRSMLTDENSNMNANFYNVYNRPNLIYDFDCDLSKNMVRVSLRHKRTLLQKAKILLSLLIPGFFDMSRLDALLPICFIMCILLLLNAFVLLNKVNQVDDLFTEILSKQDF